MAQQVHVHHRGERGVDGILHLIELAGHDGELEPMLAAMCDEIAAIAGVDVVSVYVLERCSSAARSAPEGERGGIERCASAARSAPEGERGGIERGAGAARSAPEGESGGIERSAGARAGGDSLVMRGNHGFPRSALGTALAVGEGITGLVAECMRPVSAADAASETSYKHVPGIGEERFPVFVGVPLIGGGAVIGVLVLQRRGAPFEAGEITLAMALGAPVTLAIERHRLSATRSARLAGTPHAGGAVLGRANVVPTATAIDDIAPADIERALNRLRDELGRAIKRLAAAPDEVGATLDRLALMLCDARLRERLTSGDGLRAVARDYLRAAIRHGDGASDVEDLCVLLAASLRPGAVWIADRVGPFTAIAAVARGASALVACGAIDPIAIAIARAASLPMVSDVTGLFGWARPGDLLAVDGDAGVVLVHPAQAEIERLRASRA